MHQPTRDSEDGEKETGAPKQWTDYKATIVETIYQERVTQLSGTSESLKTNLNACGNKIHDEVISGEKKLFNKLEKRKLEKRITWSSKGLGEESS